MKNTTLEKKELLDNLLTLKPALSSNSYIPALSHFAFNKTKITAYNDILAVGINYKTDLELCLPGDLLIKSLNSFGDDQISLDFNKDFSVSLTSGKSKIKLQSLEIEDFPFYLPKGQAQQKIKLEKSFITGIEKCLISINSDPNHPAQMGITITSEDGEFVLYSTDNFTISRFKTGQKGQLKEAVILPKMFCVQLVNLSKTFSEEETHLEIRKESLLALFGEVCFLFVKMLADSTPINFTKIIDRYYDGQALTDIPLEFDSAFQRALLILSNEPQKITKVQFKDDLLSLKSVSQVGEVTDEVKFNKKFVASDEFYADPQLIMRASKLCNKVAILKDAIILGNNDLSFIHLVSFCGD